MDEQDIVTQGVEDTLTPAEAAKLAEAGEEKERPNPMRHLKIKEDKKKKQKDDEKADKKVGKFSELEDDDTVSISIRTIMGGDVLGGRWFRRQFPFLLLLVMMAILYVTNRYAYQKEIIENRKLTHQLEDRRLRAVVATSDLTEFTRRSNIIKTVSDTTLDSSPAPYYYLQAN